MADYQIITAPDGEEIEFPANMPDEQISTIMQKQYGKPSLGRTAFVQGMQGATGNFADEAMARLAAVAATAQQEPRALLTGEITDPALAEQVATVPQQMAHEVQTQLQQRPVLSIASQIAGGLGTGAALTSTKAGQAVASGLRNGLVRNTAQSSLRSGINFATKVLQAGGIGALSSGIYGAGSAPEGMAGQGFAEAAPLGAAIGGALPVVGAVGSKAVKAVAPKVDEGLLPVAQLAQKYKVPVSIDELTSSKAWKNVQKVSQELPFSGQAAFRDKQMEAFNQALTGTFGKQSKRITPEIMDKAFKEVGAEFDSLGRGKTFQLGDQFKSQIDDVIAEAQSTANADAIENLQKALQNVVYKNADPSGSISGEKLSFVRQRLNELSRKATNFDTKELLKDLENAVIDVMTEGDDAAKGALSAAKQKYKNLLVVEPLAAKAKGGAISTTQLANRVSRIYGRAYTRGKAGEIGDLARIGYELLPELGGSDTTQKLAYAGLAGGVGFSAPVSTTAALTANRAFQSLVNRNPNLVKKMIEDAAANNLLQSPDEKLLIDAIKGLK